MIARRLPALAGLGLMLGLAACADAPPPGPVALLPTEQFQVQVTSHPEQMALGPHPDGLSPTQKAAIGQFVAEWRDNGGGVLTVSTPAAGDPRTAHLMAAAAAAYVHQMGVPNALVRLDGYTPPPAAGPLAPVRLAYDKFEAQGPNCGGAWGDLTNTGSNRIYGHYGCAVTANIAAEIANPRDLLAPAVATPSDASRRQEVLAKYRTGDLTSSAKDTQASGKVSDTNQ